MLEWVAISFSRSALLEGRGPWGPDRVCGLDKRQEVIGSAREVG